MKNLTKDTYNNLLDVLAKQEDLINQQCETVLRLVNESVEKEQIINELMAEKI